MNTDVWRVMSREQSHNNELQYYTPSNVRVSSGKVRLDEEFPLLADNAVTFGKNRTSVYLGTGRFSSVTTAIIPIPHPESLNLFSIVSLRSSQLVITPLEESYGSKSWTSGRVDTKGLAAWRYGRFKIRAKLPEGKGLWSAIWMMPRDSVFGGWAASGEVDIMEGDGSHPTKTSSALHFSDKYPNNRYTGVPLNSSFPSSSCSSPTPSLSSGFHDYVLVWTPKVMHFLVDDIVTWSVDLDVDWHWDPSTASPYAKNGQPWDQYFYLIINVAVGGWFLENPATGEGERWSSPTMEVDR